MTNIEEMYFNWLCKIITLPKPYKELLSYLHKTEFTFILPMDENRCADGVDLRYRFGDEHNIEGPVIASCLDDRPCSILEMMVALCLRCEENIMEDPNLGPNPGRWFWMMIRNLGLIQMYDGNFDLEYVNGTVWRFLNREYDSDGSGGLVYIPCCKFDMRQTEIWYQMARYLTEYLRNGE